MQVDVMPMGAHEFAVNVTDGDVTTAHRVEVPPPLLDEWGQVDEETLVHESVAVFLDHQNAAALPKDLTLEWIAASVSGFDDELRARLV